LRLHAALPAFANTAPDGWAPVFFSHSTHPLTSLRFYATCTHTHTHTHTHTLRIRPYTGRCSEGGEEGGSRERQGATPSHTVYPSPYTHRDSRCSVSPGLARCHPLAIAVLHTLPQHTAKAITILSVIQCVLCWMDMATALVRPCKTAHHPALSRLPCASGCALALAEGLLL
jgi:hypothetical protein